jgi:DNA-binding winged helix-turn-helix (wHTH) protein
VLRFGVFELDPKSGELRKNGALVKLQPQPFKVLALLASRPRQVITREEIREQIWGSERFVDFERGLNFCVKQIRAALGDDAERPRYIETLPKRGYRFLASVEAGGKSGKIPAERLRWIAVVVVLVAVIVYLLWPRINPPREKIMLVVLPFENLSADPEQEYFSKGLTDELTTQLGQLNPKRLGVIGRETAKEVADRSVAEIGPDLGVTTSWTAACSLWASGCVLVPS